MNEDMLNVMGSFISTELDAFENLHKELEEKDKKIEKLEVLVECLYHKVVLNQEQEELLDHILFGGDKE